MISSFSCRKINKSTVNGLDRVKYIPFLWTYVPIRITYTEVCKNFHLVMV